MTLELILNELDELGARIDAIASLGAGIAAALASEAIAPDDVYHMLATYAGGLLALQKKVRSQVAVATARATGRDPAPAPAAAAAQPTNERKPRGETLERRSGDVAKRTHEGRHAVTERGAARVPG